MKVQSSDTNSLDTQILSSKSSADYVQAFLQARAGQARHRDIAHELGLSEAALLGHISLHCDHPQAQHESSIWVQALSSQWTEPWIVQDFWRGMSDLGSLMALTRNEACVVESVRTWQWQVNPQKLSMVGEKQWGTLAQACDSQTRVLLQAAANTWVYAFAVSEIVQPGQPPQRSVQFFDAQGYAVLKLFLRQSHEVQQKAFRALARQWAVQDAHWRSVLLCHAAAAPTPRTAFPLLDKTAYTHQHVKLGLSADAVEVVLRVCAQQQLPVQIELCNSGVQHTQTGLVQHIVRRGPWLNVLDHDFNLHLREDLIATVLSVSHPTAYGLCGALELFDAQGQAIVRIAKDSRPARYADAVWARMLDELQENYAIEAVSNKSTESTDA